VTTSTNGPVAGSKIKLLLHVIALLLGIASPAVAASGPAPAQAVTVVASEYQFSPNKLTFTRGVTYRLHLENHGKETHEFTAPEFFKSIRLGDTAALNADKSEIVLQPGEAKDLRFVPQKAGRYPFKCADHDWAGMTGEITVK
jgi:uncharacterized cupredoxin-like copper-binding protein